MNDFFQDSVYAGVAISLITYVFGDFLKRKFKKVNLSLEF